MNRYIILCLSVLILLSPPAFAQTWTVETVAPFGWYFDLAVDGSGTPHVLFTACRAWEVCLPNPTGARELTYGKKTGSGWVFETVANDAAGFHIRLIVDGEGRPHLAYCDSTWQMHYGYRDTGGWHNEDIYHPVLGYYRASPDLVLDAAGEPHVAYIERETIHYAYKPGGVWTEEKVDGSGLDNWSARCAIVIDSGGGLHVGSWMYYASAVFFSRDLSTWTYDLVGGDIGWNPWMVLDSNDAAHFVYHGHNGVSYATNAGGSWGEELIDANARNEDDDIALDANGRPIVAYSISQLLTYNPPYLYDVDLYLAWRDNSGWEKELVAWADSVTEGRTGPRIETDSSDKIHLLYSDPETEELVYATRSVPTSVNESAPSSITRILSVVPNPFNPASEIVFHLDSRRDVRLAVYDVTGRRVRDLVRSSMPAGEHRIPWDGRMESGAEAPSGVYFVRLETGGFVDTRRAVLLK